MVAFPHRDPTNPQLPQDLPTNVKVTNVPGQVLVLRKYGDLLDQDGEKVEMAYGIFTYDRAHDTALIWHVEVPLRENRRKGYGSDIIRAAKHLWTTVLMGTVNGAGEALLRKNGFELMQGPFTGNMPLLGWTTLSTEEDTDGDSTNGGPGTGEAGSP